MVTSDSERSAAIDTHHRIAVIQPEIHPLPAEIHRRRVIRPKDAMRLGECDVFQLCALQPHEVRHLFRPAGFNRLFSDSDFLTGRKSQTKTKNRMNPHVKTFPIPKPMLANPALSRKVSKNRRGRVIMRTRAAVAVQAGKPLEIMDVNLDGPRAGEVLVEIKATGICHTDEFTRSGADPEGMFPAILGHEGAGIVVEVGPGVTSLKPGDHVIPLYTPECRECEYCLHPKTNLCQAIRSTQGQGLMPDGSSRFSMLDGTPILHYMGCSTFSNHTVLPEIALAKIREDAPFDKVCYIGCGVTTGIGAVINTAKVEIGSRAIVFGLGGIGLNVIQGLRLAGADQIVGVDLNPDKVEMATRFGMTHFVNPSEVEGDLVPYLVDLTKGGADYTFDATGNVKVMRDALECAHKGWGESIIIGVAPAGAEIATRPFQLVTGRTWKGTAFGGARGRTDVPKIVDWYMDGKIEIDPMITHTMPLEDINKGFDLMHAGESIRSVVIY